MDMHPDTGSNLERYEEYGRLAKAEHEAESRREQVQAHQDVSDYVQEVARFTDSRVARQWEIFDIQKDKQGVMERLKMDIAKLYDPEAKYEQPANTRFVRFDNGQLWQYQEGEPFQPLTEGDILTDGEWGISYYLDPESVPLLTRKRFLIESAKRELRGQLNEQILIDELSSGKTEERHKRSYRGIERHKKDSWEHTGIIAERMVRTLLKKIAIDADETDYTVKEAHVKQDVVGKIDFIVHRKSYRRGVGVESRNDKGDAKIQFTTNTSRENLAFKQAQLREVGDVLLVTLPESAFKDAYTEWAKDRSSGGPVEYWPEETQKEIFANVTRGILTDDEITRDWRSHISKRHFETDPTSSVTSQPMETMRQPEIQIPESPEQQIARKLLEAKDIKEWTPEQRREVIFRELMMKGVEKNFLDALEQAGYTKDEVLDVARIIDQEENRELAGQILIFGDWPRLFAHYRKEGSTPQEMVDAIKADIIQMHLDGEAPLMGFHTAHKISPKKMRDPQGNELLSWHTVSQEISDYSPDAGGTKVPLAFASRDYKNIYRDKSYPYLYVVRDDESNKVDPSHNWSRTTQSFSIKAEFPMQEIDKQVEAIDREILAA